MNDNKKSCITLLMEWAKPQKSLYLVSILLAIGNVILKLIPYLLIADIVKMYLIGYRNFNAYLMKAVLIGFLFVIAELFHSLSTTLSHKATFKVLSNIRKMCCDKLATVSLGFVKDTPSGKFKNIMIERIDSIETTLAHIVPEFTSNLLVPIIILVYFFILDWRLALFSLIPVILGFLSYGGMMIDFKPNFERTVKATYELNDAAVEYIDGIEVIKVFGRTKSSYEKFILAAKEYASSFIDWMRKCACFHGLMMTITPYTLLTVLPVGAYYVGNGSLSIPDYVICIILSLGIVGPLITIGSYTDDLGKIGVIVDEVEGILSQPDVVRPNSSKEFPKDYSISLENVKFAYHEKEVLHGNVIKLSD